MKKSFLEKEAFLYRGMVSPDLKSRAGKLIGKELEAEAFWSTSTDRKKASYFGAFEEGQVLFRIRAKRGIKAINMDVFESGTSRGEREILLDRKQKFKIRRVREGTETTPTIIDMETL
jgi:hypothetical protein